MYALLFAGGVGQRLWPLSRKNSPKQFSPIIGSRSSLQLAVERLLPVVPPEHIYISTNERYADVIAAQTPYIPRKNLLLEPERRDVAAAAALAFFRIRQQGASGPILFQWADNYIQNEDELRRVIRAGVALIQQDARRVIFLGQIPRFANENFGYIRHGRQLGESEGVPYYEYHSLTYRPPLEECERMVQSGEYLWNAGYFVSSVEFLTEEYRALAPEITGIVEEIVSYAGTPQEDAKLRELYRTIPAIHFDEAFLMRLKPEQSLMMKNDLGWSDPGSLNSLKEALESTREANVTQGSVVTVQTSDSLVYNEDSSKVVAVMGMEGVIVINTGDTVLVIHKDSVRHIKALLSALESEGHADLL